MNPKPLILLFLSVLLFSSASISVSAATLSAPANYYTSIVQERTSDAYNNSSKYMELDPYGEPYPYSYYYYSSDPMTKELYVTLYSAFHDRVSVPLISSTDTALIGGVAEAVLDES